ncbi:MAG: hypothetical protein RLN88_04970 [Ekhidna sp.]
MVAEIGIPVQNGEFISIEIDSEMEHEESSEDEKEKTTGNLSFIFPEDGSLEASKKRIAYTDSCWKSPSLDFRTPPPDLS